MGHKLSLARAACGNFLSELRDGDMAAVYSFSGFKVKMLQDFSESRDAPTPSGSGRPATIRRFTTP